MSPKMKRILYIVVFVIAYAVTEVIMEEKGIRLGAIPVAIIWFAAFYVMDKFFSGKKDDNQDQGEKKE